MWLNPNSPAGDWPIAFSAISAFGAVAARKQALLTEPALAAANGEGDDNAIADLEVFDFGAQLDHLAHVLVTRISPLSMVGW